MSNKAKLFSVFMILQIILIIKMCFITMNDKPNRNESLKVAIHKTHLKFKVTATMYNPVKRQCDSTPLITAGNYRIKYWKASKQRWIAVSRDLLKRWGGKFKYGDKVRVLRAGHKSGIYTIVDTMNPRYTHRIDILETVGTKWYQYKNVIIEKL